MTPTRPRGRFDVRVLLPAGLIDDQRARLERVADTCPVRRALEAGFTFDEELADAAQPTSRRWVSLA